MHLHLSPRAVCGLAALVAVLAFLPAAVASGSAGWVSTSTQAEPLGGTTLLGPAPAATPMHITVALNLNNKSGLQKLVSSGQTITPSQFASSYAPTSGQATQVANYLKSTGFKNVTVDPSDMLVTADGTAASVKSAFNATISNVSLNGATSFVNTTAAQVPATLSGVVASVLGLQNLVKMTIPSQLPPPTDNVGALYTPQDFWKFYDATSAPTGKSTSIAIFTEGNVQPAITQLGIQESSYGLPKVPVTVEQTGPQTADTAGEVEWEIDSQNSTGMADGVKRLYIYNGADLTDATTTLEFTAFAHQDLAKAGSASFGECEYQAYLDGSMVATDDAALEAAAQGQTLFASSGDQGGFCPYEDTNGIGPGGPPFASYPASSDYFVGVGGTSLFSNADYTRGEEIAWYTSGGGTSLFELQESWQQGVVPATGTVCSTEYAVSCGRGVPDIAMDADAIISPGAYFDNGTAQAQGGTSLASPLALGSWARFETGHSNTLGWATPYLYRAAGSAGYNDITEGDCEPYPATSGYDFCTGLGSFDVAQMNKLIVPPATPPATVGAPFCNLGSGPSGNAKPAAVAPLYTGTEAHALDITAFGMKSDGKTITGAIRLDNLSSGPGGTVELDGTGDIWYVLFTYNKTTYFLEAQMPGTTPQTSGSTPVLLTFDDGTVTTSATGGEQFSGNNSTTATGVLDQAHNLVEITVPASEVGNPPAGTTLTASSAQTYAEAGTPAAALLEQADDVNGTSYKTGTTCSK